MNLRLFRAQLAQLIQESTNCFKSSQLFSEMLLHTGQALRQLHIAGHKLIFENEPLNLVDHQIDHNENGQILYPGVLELIPEFGFDSKNRFRIVQMQFDSVSVAVVVLFVFGLTVCHADGVWVNDEREKRF